MILPSNFANNEDIDIMEAMRIYEEDQNAQYTFSPRDADGTYDLLLDMYVAQYTDAINNSKLDFNKEALNLSMLI